MADKRKSIPLKTKLAALLAIHLGIPYPHRKLMTEDQVLSLVEWDHHPILWETLHPDRDLFWNIVPRGIRAHREKTKHDAKIVAKGRRIRQKEWERRNKAFLAWGEAMEGPNRNIMIAMGEAIRRGFEEGARDTYERLQKRGDLYSENYDAIDWGTKPKRIDTHRKRKIQSRGFDKTKSRKMDGTVVSRNPKIGA